MHVLYFHQHFSTRSGTTGTRSYEMARRLLARGHRVTMVCGSFDAGATGLSGEPTQGVRRGVVDGIEVIELCLPYSNRDSFLRRGLTFLRYAARSIGLAMTLRYDLIFATTTPLTAGIPGIVTRPFKRRPFVFEVRDLWPELPRAMGVIKNPLVLGAMEVLEWLSYRSADACIALSPGIAEGIRSKGVPAERIAMIPNGCDLDLFSPERQERPELEGIAPGDFVAIYAGTHGIANGLDAVLDAASVLKRRGRRDIKLLLVGDGKCKPSLVARATAEGLDNVVFLPPVAKHTLSSLVASADVGLMVLANVPAFYYGTSPNKFFDYLASGLPVLNNYPGWLSDMIRERGCGATVAPEDADALADALTALAADRPALSEMGQRGRALAEEAFDRRVLADRFVDQLERVQAGSM